MIEIKKNIYLYHGSDCVVEKPDLKKCKKYKDFGRGFYLSFEKKQGERFAEIIKKRNHSKHKYVNCYQLIEIDLLKVFQFESADINWFKFVCANRSKDLKQSKNHEFDIIVGKIADDATANVINSFLSNTYGDRRTKKAMDFALSMLLPNRLKEQICFKTEKSLKFLKFVSCEELKDE